MKQTKAKLAALAAVAITATAKDITLQWDPPAITEGITNYAIYVSQSPLDQSNYTNAPFKYNAGTATTLVVTNLAAVRWYFTATSEASGMASDISNVLTIRIPASPGNLKRQ